LRHPELAGLWIGRWLAVSGLLLSASSFALFYYCAREEPFVVFRWRDGLVIAGLGAVLMALLAAWAVACIVASRRGSSDPTLAKVLACAAVLWSAMNLFGLTQLMRGYYEDLHNPRYRRLLHSRELSSAISEFELELAFASVKGLRASLDAGDWSYASSSACRARLHPKSHRHGSPVTSPRDR
jgi:hypothetical protein